MKLADRLLACAGKDLMHGAAHLELENWKQ